MPTGYTCGVQDGTIATFPEFAMKCARAFGALITMRDEPMDAPIPEEFKPSTAYYDESEATSRALLASLADISAEEAERRAKEAYDSAVASWHERKSKRVTERQRYEAMLAEVRAWTPPSADHVGFREFMEKQLVESIDWDCSDKYDRPPVRQSGAEWVAAQRAEAERGIAYDIEHRTKEIERANERTAWVRALRASLSSAR